MAQPLTPWVPLEDVLKVYAPELIDPATGEITTDPDKQDDIAMWQAALDSATWMMWALAGGKVHPAENWVEEYSLVGSCEVIPLQGPLGVVVGAELVEACPHAQAGTALDFCQDYQRINFCCSSGVSHSYRTVMCGCGERWVRIYYRTDSTLPPGTEGRIAWFADQYMKAATGDTKNCSLPERITSVTRQGVSWSMLDPMDFLDQKLTGVGRLDSWLTAVRLQYPSATLIDPLRSQRRLSRRLPPMSASEVFVATADPSVLHPEAEFWYNPDAWGKADKDSKEAEGKAEVDLGGQADEVVIDINEPTAETELWYHPTAVGPNRKGGE